MAELERERAELRAALDGELDGAGKADEKNAKNAAAGPPPIDPEAT
jgi:hypothetical protein